jgi:chromosome segregation ATPase
VPHESGQSKQLDRHPDNAHEEIGRLREELARQHGRIDELRRQLDLRSSDADGLRNIVENVHLQLLERDKEIEDLRAETAWRRSTEESLQAGIEWHRGAETSLRERVAELEQEIEKMKETRVWRWGERFRSIRRVLHVGRESRT